MKIAIAADHAGYELKQYLQSCSYKFSINWLDLGTTSEQAVDYPDFAKGVALALSDKQCDRGLLICGSGVGASIAANKFKGIRAAVCHDTYSAHQGVEHDDMNVLVLGARVIGKNLAYDIVCSYLNARFSEEPRHLARLQKVLSYEK